MEKAEILITARTNKNIHLNGFKVGEVYEVFAVSGGKVILIDEEGCLLDLFPTYVRIVS